MAKLNTPTAEEAELIWLMRWKGNPNVWITKEFNCDPRRLYEIYYGERHLGSRAKALTRLRLEDPALAAIAETGVLDPVPRNLNKRGGSQGDLFG